MIQITRVAHVGLRTARMDVMENYLLTALGLWRLRRDEDGRSHYALGGRGAVVELIPADAPGFDHVALEIAAGVSLEEARAELERVGENVSEWTWSDPGAAGSLRITDPEGKGIQIVVPDDSFEAFRDGPGVRPHKLSHVASRVTSAPAMAEFYTKSLGFRFSDKIGEFFYFMRCNADHHAVNFLEMPPAGELHHVAFELESADELRRSSDLLAANGIRLEWGLGRHGPGHNLFAYHRDPDGRVIELNSGLDRMSHELQGYFDPRPWHTHSPQVPRMWRPGHPDDADRWGPAPPDSITKP